MEETKYAVLNDEQLKEIKQLEEKFNITLIAYNSSVIQQNFDNIPNLDFT